MASTEENRALMRRYYDEVWQNGNLAALDEFVAEDCVDHMPFPGQPPGRAGQVFAIGEILQAFPGGDYTIEDLVAEGDRVVGRWTMHATHRGAIMGIAPTGKTVTMTGSDIIRWENGKASEVWHIEDVLGMLQQIGVIPTSS
jgi:steroid delta-isomerase-like uncharacterized protein